MNDIGTMPVWNVELYIDGPVAVRNHLLTEQQKGLVVDDPFYSEIRIEPRPSTGFRATVTARARNNESAYQAALVFFGQMLDALNLTVNQPMAVSLAVRDHRPRSRYEVRRVLIKDEFEAAFKEARFLKNHSPSFLRGLSWYRKGIYTEDPFDAYLALWNAIELVAARYYRYIPKIDKDRAKNGSKSQIWECFKALWCDCDNWPLINGQSNWIDESYEIRNDVAHGRKDITVEHIAAIADKLSLMEKVAHRFLHDWREQLLELERNAPSEFLIDD